MYRMNSLDELAQHRAIAPAPLAILAAPLTSARIFARWWGQHQQWPASEPARLTDAR